jgi:hypothetical protein
MSRFYDSSRPHDSLVQERPVGKSSLTLNAGAGNETSIDDVVGVRGGRGLRD